MKYYVYQLLDPKTNQPFYIGKGSEDRAWTHNKFKDGNKNPYKDRYIKKLHRQGLEPVVDIIQYFNDEKEAYDYEETLTESIGLDNLTNIAIGARPPSRKGWYPSKETLAKRSRGLKGIPRTEEWCINLSKSKSGTNNPRYGIKEDPIAKDRRILAVLRAKNLPNYHLYKKAIALMDNGNSADKVSKELSIGRGVCFRLKNRTHGIFQAFPELK
jgi:hypothetical protein